MKPKTSHQFAQELLALPDLPIFHFDPSFAAACDEESNYTLGAPHAEVEDETEGLTPEQITEHKENGIFLGKFITIGGDQPEDYDLQIPESPTLPPAAQ